MPDKKPPQDDPAQSQRFIDMARELDADNNAAAFDLVFEGVASHAPKEPRLKRTNKANTK